MKWISPVVSSLCLLFVFAGCREEPSDSATAPDFDPAMEKISVEASDTDFIGLTETAGGALAEQRNLRHRVISVDGDLRPTTRDHRRDRVNFKIEQGKIGKVSRG